MEKYHPCVWICGPNVSASDSLQTHEMQSIIHLVFIMSYFPVVSNYSQRSWNIMLFWEPPYKGAAFEDLETLDCVLISDMSQTPRSLIQLHHILTSSWEHVSMQWFHKLSLLSTKVLLNLSFHIISYYLKEEERERLMISFWKENSLSKGKDYLKSPKSNWDMSTFLLAPRSGIHSSLSKGFQEDSSSA